MDISHATIGRGGLVTAENKREGDGCTPTGIFSLREAWYRADRVPTPHTSLPLRVITQTDCWCDDPMHPLYNQAFIQGLSPAPNSFEHLWREDGAYDVIVVIGYNDQPATPHKGSAIFMHCTHDDGRPTAGCIALPKAELLALLPLLSSHSRVTIGEKITIA
jgi:L,D-peptidoglycan transpeptidase YkuD (ErfK/YbiS/YcfS/YnhG family)